MPHLYCFVIFLAGIYTVYTYPFEEPTYYPDYYEAFGIQEPVQIKEPVIYYTPYSPYTAVDKRAGKRAQKRSDLNRLIRRLIALYGSNDIAYSGRSTGVRFGPGGR